jgi:hypothetical protein
MNVAGGGRAQTATVQTRTDKIGIIVAQRSIEAARQNQAAGEAAGVKGAKQFAHPYLGHNVDIYV